MILGRPRSWESIAALSFYYRTSEEKVVKTSLAIRLALAGVILSTLVTTQTVRADTLEFHTSESQFLPGTDNQGWWSDTTDSRDANDNYFVGRLGTRRVRNFFTFDLSSLSGRVISATLEVRRYGGRGQATETLGLFGVSTDPATLNHNVGRDSAIFDDLGSGTSYGTFTVSTSGSSSGTVSYPLNSDGVAAVEAAAGGFFSIGGALLSISGVGSQYLHGSSSGTGIQRLVVEVSTDSDGDGVPDVDDECPDSDLNPTVVIGSCDSGVENDLFDDGCTIADLFAQARGTAVNPGDLQRRVTELSNDLREEGAVSGRESGALLRCSLMGPPPGLGPEGLPMTISP